MDLKLVFQCFLKKRNEISSKIVLELQDSHLEMLSVLTHDNVVAQVSEMANLLHNEISHGLDAMQLQCLHDSVCMTNEVPRGCLLPCSLKMD